MYKCPECGYISVEPGDCPACNIPMVESDNGDEVFEDEWEDFEEE